MMVFHQDRLDDHLLVKECLEGRSGAFEGLVEKYQKTMFNVALRIVRDTEDAADVTQTAFVKAFENLKKFNPRYKFFSWLYRIVLNESLNILNQRKGMEGLDEGRFSDEPGPHEQSETDDVSRMIDHAMQDLPVEYRVVIVLRHFQNLSYRDISDVIDVPEKTVKSRLFTARQLLRRLLVKRGMKTHG